MAGRSHVRLQSHLRVTIKPIVITCESHQRFPALCEFCTCYKKVSHARVWEREQNGRNYTHCPRMNGRYTESQWNMQIGVDI